jgi:RNA polymerase sigma factor (sigma-70 family)
VKCIGAHSLIKVIVEAANENIVPVEFSGGSTARSVSLVRDIYDKHNVNLRAFVARRLNGSGDSEDVTQEVWLRLVRHQKINGHEPSFGFLCTIASNVIIDFYRKGQVRQTDAHLPLNEDAVPSPAQSPEYDMRSKEGVEVITRAFKSLNEKSRQAMILHRFRGLTYEKIGKEMGISISMVRKHIVRVLHHISKEIENYHENR